MIRFFRLVAYLFGKRALLVRAAISVVSVVLFFLIVNFTIFSIVSIKSIGVDFLSFFWKGLLHVVFVSILFVRYSYKYLVNNLFKELFEDNQEELLGAMEEFMLDNKQVAKLTSANEDNYLVRMNGYINRLPKYLRIVFTKGLSLVPFYDIYNESLQQDLSQQERVTWLVERIKIDVMKRYDNYNITIVLILIPIINWIVLLSYLKW